MKETDQPGMPDFSWREVGSRIRDWRLRLRMTQGDLAARAGISQPGLHRVEVGGTNPELATLTKIAKAIDCSVRDLVSGATGQEPSEFDVFVKRSRTVFESEQPAAMLILKNSLTTAEAVLEQSRDRSRFIIRRGRTSRATPPDTSKLKRRFVGDKYSAAVRKSKAIGNNSPNLYRPGGTSPFSQRSPSDSLSRLPELNTNRRSDEKKQS